MEKVLNKYIVAVLFLALGFAACSDWTEVDPKIHEKMTDSTHPAEYYAQLRAYKGTDHPITFGWFGNWTGKGASLEKSMAGLPDSVDVISMWGNWGNPTAEQLKDLRYVQQVKGTKALVCFIVSNVGDQLTPKEHSGSREEINQFWGWDEKSPERMKAAIEKYANAICDTIDKYNYDGFDIDYEPNYGHGGELASYRDRMLLFIQAMRKRLGDRKDTGKLLVVDGEPQSIDSKAGPLLDYFIVQAYACPGDHDLDRRLAETIRNFKGVLKPEEVAKKYVVTENFENYALKGGIPYVDRHGNTMLSLEGMARWTPLIDGKISPKGGVGTYHMEYEFVVDGHNGTYPFLRNATRIMNPPVK